jgi:uncharacterized protein (TIGR03437 family)
MRSITELSSVVIRLMTLATALLSAAALRGQVSVLTWHNDSARTGQNFQEAFLTPANVKSATFGRLATLTVDGKVDAQPLYVPGLTIPGQGVHNVLYVATEHGSLYAFDADTFAPLLKVSLLGANETTASVSCTQVAPEIGITGTPAIDLQAGPNGVIFAVSQSQDASHTFHHRLHALDLTTLTERPGSPVNITGAYPGSGAENTFTPAEHVARPALLVLNGVVYTSWGSHCDSGSYAGWILSYSETTLAQVGVLNLVPNGNDGGIWSAGSGPAADANGNIYALIGNGTFDPTLNGSGFPVHGDYGNSMVKVSTSGELSVVDYFTMSNSVVESNADTDFGSAGLILLPSLDNGQGALVSLAVGAGKDHNIYVLNQANLGKFNSNTDAIYQQLTGALPGGTWSSPAWFNGSLYYAGSGDNLRQFKFANGAFSLAAISSAQFPFPGSTPSISANGILNGIVWAIENTNPAVLHAYDAANFPAELYNSNQAANSRDHFGAGNKYIVPTVVNGKVYVGTTTGVGVFGLLAPAFSLTTNVSPSGGGTVTPASGSTYASGTVVNLQATPSAGYSFVNWTSSPDSVASSTANPTTITMNAVESVTANFGSSAPGINITSVGNAASFGPSFAPGMLMSVFGAGMSFGNAQTIATTPLPLTSSSGTSITINGIATPLLYISPTQINLQIPYEAAVGKAVLTVSAGGQTASINLTIQAAAPGIFVDSQTGHIVPNEAAAGGSTLAFFITGAGLVTPGEPTGNVPTTGTTPVPNLPVTLRVGGVPVTPVYVGIPTWSVGVLQINFVVPVGLAAGPQPVLVTIGGVSSAAALLTITSS